MEKLNPEALAESAAAEDSPRDGVQEVDAAMILAYVLDRNELPPESARPFADWIHEVWTEFVNPEESVTNREVIEGALEHWCGGRVFPP
ncbi:hypothetical protein [Streptomyces sp. 5-10]|uniref:hypothetical protein n=1 Tax=Streptomyces sp. 5-10 TaxID=878925 RepID=UPI00168BCD0A|nr:hypothetical protein [Streptomyces sp. 5-10]MBD3004595.1 hypothetical protein [Streptomyces sp. 5-10]